MPGDVVNTDGVHDAVSGTTITCEIKVPAGYKQTLNPLPACRCTVHTVLATDATPDQVASTSCEALLLAYLRRLAKDPSILRVEPAESQGSAQGRARHRALGQTPCLGCTQCNGPEWAFKTETVAWLWTNFCEPCPPML